MVCSMGQDGEADREQMIGHTWFEYTLSDRFKKLKNMVGKDRYGPTWGKPRQCQYNASEFTSGKRLEYGCSRVGIGVRPEAYDG